MSAVTDVVVAAAFVSPPAVLIGFAARAKARNRRRYSVAELADLTRDDIDPRWERTRTAVEALNGDLEPPDGEATA